MDPPPMSHSSCGGTQKYLLTPEITDRTAYPRYRAHRSANTRKTQCSAYPSTGNSSYRARWMSSSCTSWIFRGISRLMEEGRGGFIRRAFSVPTRSITWDHPCAWGWRLHARRCTSNSNPITLSSPYRGYPPPLSPLSFHRHPFTLPFFSNSPSLPPPSAYSSHNSPPPTPSSFFIAKTSLPSSASTSDRSYPPQTSVSPVPLSSY